MPSALAGLRRDRTKAMERLDAVDAASKGRSKTADEQRDFDAAAAEVEALDRQIETQEAALEQIASTSLSRTDASEIAKICVEAGFPAMTSALLAQNVSVHEAKARISAAGEIKTLVESARRKEPSIPADFATTLMNEGKTVAQVRETLFDRICSVEAQTQINPSSPLPSGAGATSATASMQRQLQRAGLKPEA